MIARNLKLDKTSNEWMIASQYKKAMMEDFKIKCTVQVVFNAVKDGKIAKMHCKNILGKKAYNYTQSVIGLLSESPKIAPPNFKEVAKAFKDKQSKKAGKTIALPTSDGEDDDYDEDDDLSVAVERAKHEKIKRQRSEFEFDIMKGNFMAIQDVSAILSTIGVQVRQAMLSIIPRTKKIIAHETDFQKIAMLLEKEITSELNQLDQIDEIVDGSFEKLQLAREAEENK